MNELHTIIQSQNVFLIVVLLAVAIVGILMVAGAMVSYIDAMPLMMVILVGFAIIFFTFGKIGSTSPENEQLQTAINNNYPVSVQGSLPDSAGYDQGNVVQFLANYKGATVPCEFHITQAKGSYNFFATRNTSNVSGLLYCQKNDTPVALKTK